MTATHETPMSLFSHNKCGKVTTIKRCMEAGLIFYFTFYLFGGAYTPNPTGLLENQKPGAPAPFPVSVEKHFFAEYSACAEKFFLKAEEPETRGYSNGGDMAHCCRRTFPAGPHGSQTACDGCTRSSVNVRSRSPVPPQVTHRPKICAPLLTQRSSENS